MRTPCGAMPVRKRPRGESCRTSGPSILYVRLCPVLFGFYETTDVFFGTLVVIDGLGRILADSNGQTL